MDTEIDWNDVIKKEARGIDEADLGEVQEVSDNYVIVQKGIIEKNVFQISKNQVKSYDGQVLRFNISESELKNYEIESSQPSVREQYLSTTDINSGGGSGGGIHIEKDTTQSNSDRVISNNINSEKDPTSKQIPSIDESIISPSNIPKISKILVCHDGEKKSDYALNYAIYFSNITGAEIVILNIIEDIERLSGTSVKISDISQSESEQGNQYKQNIEGELVSLMEDKIKECKAAGCKGDISYKFRIGNFLDEVVKETDETRYDLGILATSYVDSWLKSMFSDSIKIVRKINIPVLLIRG
ncbi:hypothetical protein BH23THE1_BH23THE1_33410 [soil metagenome]